MPIVFVHGVATRDEGTRYTDYWAGLERFLRDYIAPVVSSDPSQVRILDAYWGDLGIGFAWNGQSRPRSALLGKGTAPPPTGLSRAVAVAEAASVIRDVPEVAAPAASDDEFVAKGPATPSGPAAVPLSLKDLSPEDLSDLLSSVAYATFDDAAERAQAAAAADNIAHAEATRAGLAACPDADAEARFVSELIRQLVEAEPAQKSALIGKGPGLWQGFKDRLGEATGRAAGAPGLVLTRALTEVRKPANDLVTLFLGDVFKYVGARGGASAPGPIPLRVMGVLKAARDKPTPPQEPLVVLTHSMGGQVVYDLVTSFLPALPEGDRPRVDFWCATASQVGVFGEMGLFLNKNDKYGSSHGNKIPFPDRHILGGWWNVWDQSDFISYTAEPIFEGVDDEEYDSGMSVLRAHGGYLVRPSFYRRFAVKLQEARRKDWWRPRA